MIKRIFVVVLIALSGLFQTAMAQQMPQKVSAKESKTVLEKIAKSYSNWGKVGLNGSLSTDFLPIKVTLKVYMERDKSMFLSVVAPLIGEAARMELDMDSLVLVFKMKNIYCAVDSKGIEKIWPNMISDVQSMFLGRAFVWQKGMLTVRNLKDLDIYRAPESSQYLAMPSGEPGIGYGFGFYPDLSLKSLVAQAGSDSNMIIFEYSWPGEKKMTIDVEAAVDSHNYKANIYFDAPQWGAKPFDRFVPGPGMRRVSLKEFLSAF